MQFDKTLADETLGAGHLDDRGIGAQRNEFRQIGHEQFVRHAGGHVALGEDDRCGPDHLDRVSLEFAVHLDHDFFNSGLAQKVGRQDRHIKVAAQGHNRDFRFVGADAFHGLGVNGVGANGFRHVFADPVDLLFIQVHGQNVGASLREGSGDLGTESSQSNHQHGFSHVAIL